jgi:hypothetical protein
MPTNQEQFAAAIAKVEDARLVSYVAGPPAGAKKTAKISATATVEVVVANPAGMSEWAIGRKSGREAGQAATYRVIQEILWAQDGVKARAIPIQVQGSIDEDGYVSEYAPVKAVYYSHDESWRSLLEMPDGKRVAIVTHATAGAVDA